MSLGGRRIYRLPANETTVSRCSVCGGGDWRETNFYLIGGVGFYPSFTAAAATDVLCDHHVAWAIAVLIAARPFMTSVPLEALPEPWRTLALATETRAYAPRS